MSPQRNGSRQRFWAIRRRWLWPAHAVAAATLGLLMAAQLAADSWILLIGLWIALLSFDLSLSARMEMMRARALEAAILWIGVVLGAAASVVSLVVWIRDAISGGG